MSQYDFDGNQDGEWEENENVAWNESDWQEYVRKSDKEISRFISAYNKSRNEPDRLEATAKLMDWGKDDWSCIEDFELDEEQLKEIRPIPLEDLNKIEPYTVHKHPLYIASSALFSFLRSSWEHMMRHNRNQPPQNLSHARCTSRLRLLQSAGQSPRMTPLNT